MKEEKEMKVTDSVQITYAFEISDQLSDEEAEAELQRVVDVFRLPILNSPGGPGKRVSHAISTEPGKKGTRLAYLGFPIARKDIEVELRRKDDLGKAEP